LKNTVPRRWSANSINNPEVKTGMARTASSEVASTAQTKIGMRSMVIPGARIRRIVTMKLMAPSSDDTPTMSSPSVQRSSPVPP